MKSRDFVYWLQGFFEISGTVSLTHEQVTAIKNHLNLVFKHEIDPQMGGADVQKTLNHLHSPHDGDIRLRC